MSARTSVYKVEVMVIDHDEIGEGGVISAIENARYPNRCIAPRVMGVETRAVDWHDRHPLNLTGQSEGAYRELFSIPPTSRWVRIERTSPSGKSLFVCTVCGRMSVAPDKTCHTLEDPEESWNCSQKEPR